MSMYFELQALQTMGYKHLLLTITYLSQTSFPFFPWVFLWETFLKNKSFQQCHGLKLLLTADLSTQFESYSSTV